MFEARAGTDVAIDCQQLSKQYGSVTAVDSLDLKVTRGAIFGFLGRNGAGKTTTIRLLTGLAQPTAGTAWVNGIETSRADGAVRNQFGYLPQDPSFYNWMTPREYLDYVARLFRFQKPRRERRVGELLELVDLQKAADRKIGGFSGGMIQRLGIAQAFIHQPPVLFLDEPTSALDPAGRHDVLELIGRLRGRTTVFLSSHILADIERVCDTVGIVHEGRLLLVADREELLARYASNSILLEIDRTSLPLVEEFLAMVREQPWATAASADHNQVRIAVTEDNAARSVLLALLVKQGIVLNRYEWVRPSLEEVFLSLSR